MNVATLQPPAGAGNVVTVFVPGLAATDAPPGALTMTIPDPPAAPATTVKQPDLVKVPPAPPPELTVPAVPGALRGPCPPLPPPPGPPFPLVVTPPPPPPPA